MRIRILSVFLLISNFIFAGWTNMNTGINDKLTGVVFWGTNGVVSGYKGIYYTTNGGNGPGSWTRFNISGNSADSLVYTHTQFYHAYSDMVYGSNKVFACGKDTVAGKAVIMLFNLPALTYSIIYTGPVNSSLNRIAYCSQNTSYYAVGNNGLVVNFNATTSSAVISNLSYDLKAINFSTVKFFLVADGVFISGTNNSNNFRDNNEHYCLLSLEQSVCD